MFENWGEFLCQLSSIVTLNLCLHFITVIKLSLSPKTKIQCSVSIVPLEC